jgi:FkbM family methyltransferase
MKFQNKKDRFFCDSFIDKNINNEKDNTFGGRSIAIQSDPNNLLIPRVENAGEVIIDGKYVVMHNGITVTHNTYYGEFSNCLQTNLGCHEPSEERMFQEVLNDIDDGATMVELGSYWAFYSIWFNKQINNARNFCIEPVPHYMNVGKENAKLNKVSTMKFIADDIGHFELNQCFDIENTLEVYRKTHKRRKFKEHIKTQNIEYIDLLHCDIQGNEIILLPQISDMLEEKKIKYIFISSHSDSLHDYCINFLKNKDYRIIASADFEKETFCHDGVIVACPSDLKNITETSLGCRRHTPLREKSFSIDEINSQ